MLSGVRTRSSTASLPITARCSPRAPPPPRCAPTASRRSSAAVSSPRAANSSPRCSPSRGAWVCSTCSVPSLRLPPCFSSSGSSSRRPPRGPSPWALSSCCSRRSAAGRVTSPALWAVSRGSTTTASSWATSSSSSTSSPTSWRLLTRCRCRRRSRRWSSATSLSAIPTWSATC